MSESHSQYYSQFKAYLDNYDKDNALDFSMMLLKEDKVSVNVLYEEILSPALNSIFFSRQDEDQNIWREHVMTNIVRTVVECSYPYVLKEKEKYDKSIEPKRVMILCPEEEYHEIGARMGADFFTITNCEVFFIGCNTPKENFYSAFSALKPDIITISVTNFLNLVPLKKIISEIKEKSGNKVLIILSGSAFKSANKTAKDFGADILVNSYKEIDALRRSKHETGI